MYDTYETLRKMCPKKCPTDPRKSVACTLSVEIRQVAKLNCTEFFSTFCSSHRIQCYRAEWPSLVLRTQGKGGEERVKGRWNGCNGRAAQSDASGITAPITLRRRGALFVPLAHTHKLSSCEGPSMQARSGQGMRRTVHTARVTQ